MTRQPHNPLAAAREAERIADRYIARDGEPMRRSPARQAVEAERRQLEVALEIVRKALPKTKRAATARDRLDFIEKTLIRDYGLWETRRR
jgi:hypothetical protein